MRFQIIEKIKKLRARKPAKKGVNVPASWLKPDAQTKAKALPKGYVRLEKPKMRKLHIPGLRTGKRVLATFLLAINFVISQAALTSAQNTQPMFALFLLNSFILLDYIWKTRSKKKIEKT